MSLGSVFTEGFTPRRRHSMKGGRLGLLALCVAAVAGCSQPKPMAVPRGPALAKSACASTTFAGFPKLNQRDKTNFFLCHKGHASEFNPKTRVSLWVTEHLMRDDLTKNNARIFSDFRPDPQLSVSAASNATHYQKTGYDAGHLAPPEDFPDSSIKTSHTFYLSNAVAQNPVNNKGVWRLLEGQVREWAKSHGEIYVVSGPIFSGGVPKAWLGQVVDTRRQYTKPTEAELIGQKMAVPTHLYKVILDPQNGQAIAFVVPNEPVSADLTTLASFAVPVATLESIVSIQFFPDLNPAQTAAVKNQIIPGAWPLSDMAVLAPPRLPPR